MSWFHSNFVTRISTLHNYSGNALGRFSACPRLILANTPIANIHNQAHHYKMMAIDGGCIRPMLMVSEVDIQKGSGVFLNYSH